LGCIALGIWFKGWIGITATHKYYPACAATK
jgi:hypothetical protein